MTKPAQKLGSSIRNYIMQKLTTENGTKQTYITKDLISETLARLIPICIQDGTVIYN